MSLDKTQLQNLHNALNDRIRYLSNCNARFETSLDADTFELLNPPSGPLENISPEVIEYAHYLDISLGNTFRYSMFTGACTFHVEMLTILGKFAIPTYDDDYKALKRTNGSDIAKNLQLFANLGIVLPAQLGANVEDFRIVRNSIIHDWGDIVNGSKATETKAAIERLNKQYEHAVFSRVGYSIYMEDDGAVPFAIDTAQQLLDFMTAELGKLP